MSKTDEKLILWIRSKNLVTSVILHTCNSVQVQHEFDEKHTHILQGNVRLVPEMLIRYCGLNYYHAMGVTQKCDAFNSIAWIQAKLNRRS